MGEHLNDKINYNLRRRWLAILSAGTFVMAGCSDLSSSNGKIFNAESNTSDCTLETVNSKIKGNPACIDYRGDERVIKVLTKEGRIFARVIQTCNKTLKEESIISGVERHGPVTKIYQNHGTVPICSNGLQPPDAGTLNKYIIGEVLPTSYGN